MTELYYENLGTTITVPLPADDFKIVAMADYDKQMNCYRIKLYMDKKDINFLDLIDDEIAIEADYKIISERIL